MGSLRVPTGFLRVPYGLGKTGFPKETGSWAQTTGIYGFSMGIYGFKLRHAFWVIPVAYIQQIVFEKLVQIKKTLPMSVVEPLPWKHVSFFKGLVHDFRRHACQIW